MRPSTALYSALAEDYERHFNVPHRRAYDDLAWELVTAVLPVAPAVVVDAGAGIGRWSRRLLDLGYQVVAIENAPAMAERLATLTTDPQFSMIRGDMQSAELPTGSIDAVIAMGSVQYTVDPTATVARMAGWLRPGGTLHLLVDSREALVLELLRAGRTADAAERARTRMGTWRQRGSTADLHLFAALELAAALDAAGLDVVRSSGLLVGASVLGIDELSRQLLERYHERLAVERELAQVSELADLGKQLLVIGRRR